MKIEYIEKHGAATILQSAAKNECRLNKAITPILWHKRLLTANAKMIYKMTSISHIPLSIREMSVRFGVSFRALRFYESIGLISPQRIGTERYYEEKDIKKLQIILKGKRFEFSLQEIGLLIKEGTKPGAESSELHMKLDDALRQIALLQAKRHQVSEAIEELKNALLD